MTSSWLWPIFYGRHRQSVEEVCIGEDEESKDGEGKVGWGNNTGAKLRLSLCTYINLSLESTAVVLRTVTRSTTRFIYKANIGVKNNLWDPNRKQELCITTRSKPQVRVSLIGIHLTADGGLEKFWKCDHLHKTKSWNILWWSFWRHRWRWWRTNIKKIFPLSHFGKTYWLLKIGAVETKSTVTTSHIQIGNTVSKPLMNSTHVWTCIECEDKNNLSV